MYFGVVRGTVTKYELCFGIDQRGGGKEVKTQIKIFKYSKGFNTHLFIWSHDSGIEKNRSLRPQTSHLGLSGRDLCRLLVSRRIGGR